MKTTKLFKSLKNYNNKFDLEQLKEGVRINNLSEFGVISILFFLRSRRDICNGMDGTNLVFSKK